MKYHLKNYSINVLDEVPVVCNNQELFLLSDARDYRINGILQENRDDKMTFVHSGIFHMKIGKSSVKLQSLLDEYGRYIGEEWNHSDGGSIHFGKYQVQLSEDIDYRMDKSHSLVWMGDFSTLQTYGFIHYKESEASIFVEQRQPLTVTVSNQKISIRKEG